MTRSHQLSAALLAICFVTLTSCATTGDSSSVDGDLSQASEESAQKHLLALDEEAKNHFDRRTDPEQARRAIEVWEAALALEDDSTIDDEARLQIYTSLSRAHYFMARYAMADTLEIEAQPRLVEELQKGHDAAVSALRIVAPEFYSSVERGAPFEADLAETNAEAKDALLWYAKNLGLLSRLQGVSQEVNHSPIVEAIMSFLATEQPDIHLGTPHRYFAVRWVRSAFNRDAERSEEAFEKAIEASPDFLLNRLLRARYLATFVGDRQLFETDLQYILDSDIESRPEIGAENEAIRRWALELVERADEFFE